VSEKKEVGWSRNPFNSTLSRGNNGIRKDIEGEKKKKRGGTSQPLAILPVFRLPEKKGRESRCRREEKHLSKRRKKKSPQTQKKKKEGEGSHRQRGKRNGPEASSLLFHGPNSKFGRKKGKGKEGPLKNVDYGRWSEGATTSGKGGKKGEKERTSAPKRKTDLKKKEKKDFGRLRKKGGENSVASLSAAKKVSGGGIFEYWEGGGERGDVLSRLLERRKRQERMAYNEAA